MAAERMSAARLYTPEVLALATGLSRFPLAPDLPRSGSARSRTCGSTLTLGIETASDGAIARLGLRVQACAIGQAAAAIFAEAAQGLTLAEIAEQGAQIDAWLAGEAPLPCVPGIAAIAPARDYPVRHGAITLAWTAARALLSSAGQPR